MAQDDCPQADPTEENDDSLDGKLRRARPAFSDEKLPELEFTPQEYSLLTMRQIRALRSGEIPLPPDKRTRSTVRTPRAVPTSRDVWARCTTTKPPWFAPQPTVSPATNRV